MNEPCFRTLAGMFRLCELTRGRREGRYKSDNALRAATATGSHKGLRGGA